MSTSYTKTTTVLKRAKTNLHLHLYPDTSLISPDRLLIHTGSHAHAHILTLKVVYSKDIVL